MEGVPAEYLTPLPELRPLAAGLRLILDQLVPQIVSSLVLLIIPQRNIIEINWLKAFSF